MSIKKSIPEEAKNSKEILVQKANQLLKKGKFILYPSSKSILRGEIKACELGKPDELAYFVPIMEKKYLRLKHKFEHDQKQKAELEERFLKPYLELSLSQLKNALARKKKEKEKLWKREAELRPDERTQRKATIKNRQVESSRELARIQEAIKRKSLAKRVKIKTLDLFLYKRGGESKK